MKNLFSIAVVLLLLSASILACGLTAPAAATPQVGTGASTQPGVETSVSMPTSAATSVATSVATSSAVPIVFPTPTSAYLNLEIVQSQLWADTDGNVRANALIRNPYDFPIEPEFGVFANLMNQAGKIIRSMKMYFLDGVSGGNGFILPGETVAANVCFTCEIAPLTEAWASVGFNSSVTNFIPSGTYSTEVEATVPSVSFNGNSPIFEVSGTVKNKSKSALSVIAARIFVFDQKGNLVGVAEGSAVNVAPGASASFIGTGYGQAPKGPVKYTVTALGASY